MSSCGGMAVIKKTRRKSWSHFNIGCEWCNKIHQSVWFINHQLFFICKISTGNSVTFESCEKYFSLSHYSQRFTSITRHFAFDRDTNFLCVEFLSQIISTFSCIWVRQSKMFNNRCTTWIQFKNKITCCKLLMLKIEFVIKKNRVRSVA